MKHVLLVLVVLALCFGIAVASEPQTKNGDRALMFTVSGLGTFGVGSSPVASLSSPLGTHNLAGFGAKGYLSDNTAIRGAVDLGWTKKDKQGNSGLDESSGMSFGLTPGIEWHFGNSGPVTAYVGAMAAFGWTQTKYTPNGGTESKWTGTIFGASAIMGVEYFPWDMMSLGAEYQLGFSTNSTKSEGGGTSVDGPTYTNFGIDSWAVTLAVYFGH